MPYLAGISIYPIKSLGPVSVSRAKIMPGGGLEHDRELALVDTDGKFMNAKRCPAIHGLQAAVDWKDGMVCLETRDGKQSGVFSLTGEWESLEAWLSRYFGLAVSLRRSAIGGFPDDLKAPGPTVIGTSTLEEVASWYSELDVPEARVRFRANLEIGGAPPFWEDRLFGEAEEVVRFRIGDVILEGTNPCQRCIVPTRDSQTGEPSPDFAQVFRARREESLPAWANGSRFNHYYRLAVNTKIPLLEEGKVLAVGDPVTIL